MKEQRVKYQVIGLKGINKNVALTKDFIIPNAVDGHFETDRETGFILEEALNIAGQPPVIVKEDHPDYVKPTIVEIVKGETVPELKDTLAKSRAEVRALKEDVDVLNKELDKLQSGTGTESLKKELAESNERIKTLETELKSQVDAGIEAAKTIDAYRATIEAQKATIEDMEKTLRGAEKVAEQPKAELKKDNKK